MLAEDRSRSLAAAATHAKELEVKVAAGEKRLEATKCAQFKAEQERDEAKRESEKLGANLVAQAAEASKDIKAAKAQLSAENADRDYRIL